MASLNARQEKAPKRAESEERTSALRKHLKEIIEGEAFKGSNRSGQFLTYIIEQAIAGNSDSLKERAIGAELFGRSPAYDTGQDAIVRVAASDVRKRLLQHYSSSGTIAEFRIKLPPGSYIPEITYPDPLDAEAQNQISPPASPLPFVDREPAPAPGAVTAAAVESPAIAEPELSRSSRSRRRWLFIIVPFAVLSLVLLGVLWNHFVRSKAATVSVLPWSVLFNSPHPIRLVTSDPAIYRIQAITKKRIPLSDYVNRNYLPDDPSILPAVRQFLLHGDWTGPGDVQIALNVSELAQRNATKIAVQPSSRTRVSDLKTDDNFIFLGSPRSNPWVSLFNDSLDFQFLTINPWQNEVIRNVRPRPNEQSIYTPAAGTVGDSYAIVAFIQNPVQDGQVLLLAGVTGEGTDIAGRLVTDLPRLSAALQQCGIAPSGPIRHFELLLHVNVMAGASSGFDVVACHILPDTPAH